MALILATLASRSSAWTPDGAVLDVPQEVNLEERIKADPNNCNVYYYLKTPLTCGEGNAFNKATLRCDSLENVARLDPACGEGGEGGFGGGGGSRRGGSGFGGSGSGGYQGAAGGNGSQGSGFVDSFQGSGGSFAEQGFGSQSQYGGGSDAEEYREGGSHRNGGPDSLQSQYESSQGSGINGFPSQGRYEEVNSFPTDYTGSIRKRSAEESSLPGYSSASNAATEQDIGEYNAALGAHDEDSDAEEGDNINNNGGYDDAEYSSNQDRESIGTKNSDNEYSDELGGYKQSEDENIGGYEKLSPRGGRGNKFISRKSKDAQDKESEARRKLQSNAWENRRVGQGWAAFKGLVGNPSE